MRGCGPLKGYALYVVMSGTLCVLLFLGACVGAGEDPEATLWELQELQC